MQVLTLRRVALTQIIVGVGIGKLRMHAPFYVFGGLVSTIAAGLFITLEANTGHSAWIGYQALAGIGIGACLNIPIIATQAIIPPEDVAPATAIILCKSTPRT